MPSSITGGGSAIPAGVVRTISRQLVPAGNAGGGEDTLFTYSDTYAVGTVLRITGVAVLNSANAFNNDSTVRLKLGGNTIASETLRDGETEVNFVSEVVFQSAGNQQVSNVITYKDALVNVSYFQRGSQSENEAAPIVISVTGEGDTGAPANDDASLKWITIEKLPST